MGLLDGVAGGIDFSFVTNILKGLLIAFPIIFLFILFFLIYKYIMRNKIYSIEINLILVTGETYTWSRDKAGIIKTNDIERMILQKRKKSLPIPPRKYWIQNDKGKSTLTLIRYGEDDFSPVEMTPIEKVLELFQKEEKFNDKLAKTPADTGITKIVDTRKAIGELDVKLFKPLPSDAKSHHLLNAKLINLRNQRTKSLDKWIPVINWAILGIVFFLMVFYGLQWLNGIIDKAVDSNQLCLKEAQTLVKMATNACGGRVAPIIAPLGEIPKPPL